MKSIVPKNINKHELGQPKHQKITKKTPNFDVRTTSTGVLSVSMALPPDDRAGSFKAVSWSRNGGDTSPNQKMLFLVNMLHSHLIFTVMFIGIFTQYYTVLHVVQSHFGVLNHGVNSAFIPAVQKVGRPT